ncbi:MAG: TetR/AcrR family transcriptional regulator [Myxococcota bacterium]|nr:TetR/AcrR family transcriptional regulator [Myxococcota bacterium]
MQRRRLLQGAIRAFETNQYEHTRVADIVREAGVSSRSFYEVFDSKEDLVTELVQAAGRALIRDLEKVFEATGDPIQRIDRGLQAYLSLFTGAPLDLDGLGATAARQVQAVRRQLVREISARVARELEQAHRSGQVSRAPDLPSIELILTGIEGLSLRYFAEGRGAELQRLQPRFLELLVRAFV